MWCALEIPLVAKCSAAMLYISHGNAEYEQIFSLLSLAKKMFAHRRQGIHVMM